MFRGIRVKTLKITLIVTFVVAIFLSIGLVSALDSNGLSAYTVASNNTPSPSEKVTLRITLQSNTDEQLQITNIGINFDWMPSDGFYGPTLSSNPVIIQSNGTYISAPFTIQIPSNASIGSHTYYVGVDGLEGTAETAFSWNSATSAIVVVGTQTTSTASPSPSPSPGGTAASPPSLLLYGAIVAIAVVIVIIVIVILVRRKPKQAAPATPVADQPTKPDEGQNKQEEKDSFDAQI